MLDRAGCVAVPRQVVGSRHASLSAGSPAGGGAREAVGCDSETPHGKHPQTEQKAAIRLLETMSKESVACHRDFYEHVVATRRRRKEDRRDRKETKNKN